MTEKANPSVNRPADAYKTSGAIAYGGHGSGGFIVDGSNPTEIAIQDSGISDGDLDSFAETSSGTSLDVTIAPGEAFVFGSWICIDVSTTVTLASDVVNQEVYVGWNKSGANDVIIGTESAFANSSGDTDEKIPLYTFDTDTNGVTSVTDNRTIGQSPAGTDKLSDGTVQFESDDGSVAFEITSNGNVNVKSLQLDGNQLDTDGDGVFDNTDVNALTSLSQGDSFSGYPLTSADISQLDSSITEIIEDTAANLPAAGTEGRILIESDTGRILYDDGASLNEVGLSESEISHDNINDVSASDHHTKTDSASELTDVSADSVADAHHTDPTAGGFIVDEATNQFGFDAEQWSRDNPDGRTPIVALESGESYELAVFVPDTKTVKLYEANAVLVGESSTGGFTTDSNLVAEIVDESGTVQYSNSGLNASADGSTLYSEGNSSGGMQLWKVRVNNTDGSATFDSPGAIGSFSVVVE